MIGYVETLIRDMPRKIEVLRDVQGLIRAELTYAVDLIVDGLRLRVLAPVKVLKAKICNVVTLNQEDRNDVNHVRIMIECVREFLKDILVEIVEERATQRDAVNLLEELRKSCPAQWPSKPPECGDWISVPFGRFTICLNAGCKKSCVSLCTGLIRPIDIRPATWIAKELPREVAGNGIGNQSSRKSSR